MKIFLSSDIHTERAHKRFSPDFDYDCLRFNYPENADVIILAGDIGEWVNGIEWAGHRFKNKEIIYVPGNHEYYDSDLAIIEDMRTKAAELGIHILDNDSVIINGVRFLGATLWTDFNQHSYAEVEKAWGRMNDYKYITSKVWCAAKQNRAQALQVSLESTFGFDPDVFSPTVSYLLHKKSLKWLEQQLVKPYIGKTVVVTHHAPSMRSSYQADYSYASNLELFIAQYADKINLWCHGHIHEPVDYKVSGVRIVSNPRGYPTRGISDGFKEDKVICL